MREEGLLNCAQAGLVLDVSTQRVSELVRLRKLTRFEFFGRPYVSLREVGDRLAQQSKGRAAKAEFWSALVNNSESCELKATLFQVGAEAFSAKARRKRK